MRKSKTHKYDELFDEVCLQLKGNYFPKNEEETAILINDVIKIVKKLSIKHNE